MLPPERKRTRQTDWPRYGQLIAISDAGEPAQALPGLEELAASTDDPEDKAAILLAVAACQRNLGRIEDARSTLSRARSVADKESPIQPRLVFQNVLSKVPDGDWKGILADLNFISREYPSILANPDNKDLAEEVGRYQGIALYRLGRRSEARPLLKEASKTEYLKARTLYYLGRCCYLLGDLPEATESLREALKLDLDPDFQPDAHYVLGMAYYWSKQSAWAIREFEWLLQNDLDGQVKKTYVLTALVNASKSLGLEGDAEKYTRMLADIEP